jgi:SAM-dependent methyltransferase
MPDHTPLDAPVDPPGRPTYPVPALSWLTGTEAVVLDFAAGTGRVTRLLVDLDHEVYAVDPAPKPLATLRSHLPDVPTAIATTTAIPLPDDSIDVLFWGEPSDALATGLPEFARVLKPGAVLALAWNIPDQRIPWVRRLAAILGIRDTPPDVEMLLVETELFDAVATETFSHWQQLDRESLQTFALSHPHIKRSHAKTRERIIGELNKLYAEYERGIDGLKLPYVAHCFRLTAALPEAPAEDAAVDEPPLIDFN